MAKGIGLIGNFRGKVGNMVGYNLKDSNNKQTQGVRVYQPVVKNPKTYGQAQQRAKLAPVNVTYRALKGIIDRGQESKRYGNKSRLAWLKDALKAFDGGWFEKGAVITAPALVPLTKGSLPNLFPVANTADNCVITFATAAAQAPATIGILSTAIKANFPQVEDGDQITFVDIHSTANGIEVSVESIVIDTTSTESIPAAFTAATGSLTYAPNGANMAAGAIILSREGDAGQHLRSTTAIQQAKGYDADLLADAAQEAATKSYMAGSTTSDWPQEKE